MPVRKYDPKALILPKVTRVNKRKPRRFSLKRLLFGINCCVLSALLAIGCAMKPAATLPFRKANSEDSFPRAIVVPRADAKNSDVKAPPLSRDDGAIEFKRLMSEQLRLAEEALKEAEGLANEEKTLRVKVQDQLGAKTLEADILQERLAVQKVKADGLRDLLQKQSRVCGTISSEAASALHIVWKLCTVLLVVGISLVASAGLNISQFLWRRKVVLATGA